MDEETKQTGYGKRPVWQWIAIYAVVGIVVYAAVYYLFLAKKGIPGYTQTQTQTTSATSQGIDVSGNEFAFSPSTLSGKVGQAMTINFKNVGQYPHNFVISDLNVKSKTIKSGESDTVTFTPDKAGTFTYICSIPGHADKGMTGTLTVQ